MLYYLIRPLRHPLLRLLRTSKIALLFAAVIASLWYWQERSVREKFTYAGVPQAESLSLNTLHRVFRNEGFMLGYSDLRNNPLWVTYRLVPIDDQPSLPRPSYFRPDWRTLFRIRHSAYSRSGYDRGHLAPNYAISRLYGRDAQLNTFLMSNITPQRPQLNRKLWQRLEEIEADYFARWFGELWVFTGPVFDSEIERLRSGVEIPDAFYKIYAVPPRTTGTAPRLLAFLIPQTVRGHEPLHHFAIPVDEIERQTGLDFFHHLDNPLEERLESQLNTTAWRLSEVSQLPARY